MTLVAARAVDAHRGPQRALELLLEAALRGVAAPLLRLRRPGRASALHLRLHLPHGVHAIDGPLGELDHLTLAARAEQRAGMARAQLPLLHELPDRMG